MNKQNLLLTISAILLFAVSCTKTDTAGTNSTNANFSSISANRTFQWNSTKVLPLIITGMKTTNEMTGTLIISEKKSTVKYYSGLHKLSDNLSLQLSIPTASDSVEIQFGSIKKTYSSKSGIIKANYLPTVAPDEQ